VGILGLDDRATIAAMLLAIRDDNPETITIRRGEGTLDPQVVRLAGRGSGRPRESLGAEETRGTITILGDTDLDIQVGDRFNDGNAQLYKVTFVEANTDEAVRARAEVIE